MTFYKSIGLSEKPHCYKTEDRAVFLNFGKVEILEMFHRTVVYIVNTCIEYNMHTSLVNDVIYYAFFLLIYYFQLVTMLSQLMSTNNIHYRRGGEIIINSAHSF